MKSADKRVDSNQRDQDLRRVGTLRQVPPPARRETSNVLPQRGSTIPEPDNDHLGATEAHRLRPGQLPPRVVKPGATLPRLSSYNWDDEGTSEALVATSRGKRVAQPGRLVLKQKRGGRWAVGIALVALAAAGIGAGGFMFSHGGLPFLEQTPADASPAAAPRTVDNDPRLAPKVVKTIAIPAARAGSEADRTAAKTEDRQASAALKPLALDDARWARAGQPAATITSAPASDTSQQPMALNEQRGKPAAQATAAQAEAGKPGPDQAKAGQQSAEAARSHPADQAGAPAAMAAAKPAPTANQPPQAETQGGPAATADPPQPAQVASATPDDATAAGPATDAPRAADDSSGDTPPMPEVHAGRTMVIHSGVNMRTAPVSGSRVIGVIPSGSTVSVGACNVWCKVSYKGREGFIYKGFVNGTGSSTARRGSHRQHVAKAKEDAPATTAAIQPAQPQPAQQPKNIIAEHRGGGH